eukprot:SAG31_NODE_4052_length_3634_cov_2.642716_1_plen_130_part_00
MLVKRLFDVDTVKQTFGVTLGITMVWKMPQASGEHAAGPPAAVRAGLEKRMGKLRDELVHANVPASVVRAQQAALTALRTCQDDGYQTNPDSKKFMEGPPDEDEVIPEYDSLAILILNLVLIFEYFNSG